MRGKHEHRRSSSGNPRATTSSSTSIPTTSAAEGHNIQPHSSDDDASFEFTYVPDKTLTIRSDDSTVRPVDIRLTIGDGDSQTTSGSTSFNPFRQLSREVSKAKNSVTQKLEDLFSGNWNESRVVVDSARERRKAIAKKLVRSDSFANRALNGLKFINDKRRVSWVEVASNFDNLAIDGCLRRTDFPECIGMRDSREFALALFDALSRKRRLTFGKLSKDELLEFWNQITVEDFDARLELFFSMVDTNDDGRLTEEEVEDIIMLSASACKLTTLKDQAGEYAALIMETVDHEGVGYIESWQLKLILLDKSIYRPDTIVLDNATRVLTTNLERQKSKTKSILKMRTNMSYFLQDNWKRIWVLCLWIFIMVGLFTWKFFQYKHKAAFEVMGYCLTTAKGAAETLKFNMALILFPVCRNTITWLRSTIFAYTVPFDDNINFHKTIAGAIVLGITLHAGLHLTCDFVRLEKSSETDYYLYLSQFNHNGKRSSYMDLVRGWEGVTGVIMVVLMAIAFTLATRNFRRGVIKLPKPFDRFTGFNTFWYSHHLFIIVYTCLLIHGIKLYLVDKWYKKTTWMYLAVPMLLYAGERTLRFFRSRLNKVRLLKVLIYPGNVLTLQMSKPLRFRYKSGQYMFLQCPVISSFQWHPFSITSSPGDDFLSVHICKLGDWTEETHIVCKEVCEPVPGRREILRGDESKRSSWPKLLIDGPYGAPAQDYRKYDVLLLVGSGIGATPFISILRDLINIFKKEEEQVKGLDLYPVPGFDTGFPVQIEENTPLDKPKAYFYWVTREHGSFDWFKGVMREVADFDKKGIIELHNHLTSVYEEGDARSTLIGMIAALELTKKGVDFFSGTKARTHFGKPDWRKIISKLGSKHPNAKIGVFYCGIPILASELKGHCNDYNQLGRTQFEFHKEQF